MALETLIAEKQSLIRQHAFYKKLTNGQLD
ncbi:MAG: hypothetical protein RLZZ196_686, partial [Bacteroidota bacterium]